MHVLLYCNTFQSLDNALIITQIFSPGQFMMMTRLAEKEKYVAKPLELAPCSERRGNETGLFCPDDIECLLLSHSSALCLPPLGQFLNSLPSTPAPLTFFHWNSHHQSLKCSIVPPVCKIYVKLAAGGCSGSGKGRRSVVAGANSGSPSE